MEVKWITEDNNKFTIYTHLEYLKWKHHHNDNTIPIEDLFHPNHLIREEVERRFKGEDK